MDETSSVASTARTVLSEGVSSLLIDHVRAAFRHDLDKLQAIELEIRKVRQHYQIAQDLLHRNGSTRVDRIQCCLAELKASCDSAAANILSFETGLNNLQVLLVRWRSGEWSELEKVEAKSAADSILWASAQEIETNERQIKLLLVRAEELFQEGQTSSALKNDAEELSASLTSASEPRPYHDALSKQISILNAAFQKASDQLIRGLAENRNEVLLAEAQVLKLKAELDVNRDRASQLDAARHIDWFWRRLDPRVLFQRSDDSIEAEISGQKICIVTAKAAAQDLEEKLDELKRAQERQVGMLPDIVRNKMIDETLEIVSNASLKLAEIARLTDEHSSTMAAQQLKLSLLKKCYAEEHIENVNAYFVATIDRAEGGVKEIEENITTTINLQLRAQQNVTRLSQLIERRSAKLDADLLDCKRREESELEHLEREQRRLRLRLRDRAARAGMIHDPTTNTFREQDNFRNPRHNVRLSYRRTGDGPSPVTSLPIFLRSRVHTDVIGWDDERLAAVLASLCGANEPSKDERAAFIDRFCDVVFGDDQEERPFFISIISKTDDSLLVLVRPAGVLPQLKDRLPEAMSVCVLCRLVYGAVGTSDNTTLLILDAALVPDCELRPFERAISLVRHVSSTSLPLVSSRLDQLLVQANALPPILLDKLQDRLNDWQGYLRWANDLILRKAPWAALGTGTWTNDTWEGYVLCEDKNAVRGISGASMRGDARQSLEVYLLKDAWQRTGREDNLSIYRCIDYKVICPAELQPIALQDCPWPSAFPYRVSMKFRRWDASALADLPDGTPLGLRDMTEAIGSQTQLSRYRNALAQLQLAPTEKLQDNRLPAAPYLMASLFNVAQGAIPTAKPGRLLNKEIAKLYRLNEDQGAAVEVMLASPEIAYIQGPPGTGKTTMIASACAHFVRSGQRVLIASQTNLAVENALERLIGDPEVRPLWLSKNEGEQKKSVAVADWYRMAADHVERAVCNPLRTLTEDVGCLENWLDRARKLNLNGSRAASELQKREDDLRRSEVMLAEVQRLQVANVEARARAAWWAMAHDALAKLSEWDPSCFYPALASDTTDLLRLFASFDGKAPRLDVSPGALHRQTQERVRGIQTLLSSDIGSEDAERIRQQILASWPSVTLPSPEHLDGEDPPSLTSAHAEVVVQRARQSFEDAQSRSNEVDAKSRTLLSEMDGIIDLPEAPTDLASAIDIVERHADLQGIRLDDTAPLGEWLPLLDQWVMDLRQQAENPPATDRMGERYVRSANVIGVTCNSDFKILSESGFPRFDVVIIDEVSKATPLELLRPMLLAPKTILVGDHRQLPPTFEFASFGSSDKSPTEDEDQDALEREAELLRKYERLTTASLFRDGFAEIDAGAKAALQTQYRMHPQIMALVNRFYDGRLESGLIDPDGLDDSAGWSWRMHGLSLNSRTGGQYLVPHLHALWIDSSDDEAGRPAYEDSDGTGIGNKLEARLVAQMVEDILAGCKREQRKKTIAVATFYNRQKLLIRKALQEKLGRPFKDLLIDVETVDRFQGKEADIVIVSMVRNRSQRLGSNSNPAKFERINVAFSRARDLLIVVGARKTFERFDVAIEPVDGGPLQRVCVYGQIIGDIKDIGGLWQAKDILGESSPQSGNRPT